MTDSSSWRPGVGIRVFRSGIALCLLLFLMLCGVALLLNAKTKDEDIEWMTSEQAFDPSHNGNAPDPDSIKKVVFDASYEEVFRAASISVAQAMWEIDKQDKAAGVLFAHRVVSEPITKNYPSVNNRCTNELYAKLCLPKEHKYFYRVKTNELSAKQTEVVVESKLQGYCDLHCTAPFGLAGRPWCNEYKQSCGELRAGISLKANDQPEISQFVVLLRNNLIAAGGQ